MKVHKTKGHQISEGSKPEQLFVLHGTKKIEISTFTELKRNLMFRGMDVNVFRSMEARIQLMGSYDIMCFLNNAYNSRTLYIEYCHPQIFPKMNCITYTIDCSDMYKGEKLLFISGFSFTKDNQQRGRWAQERSDVFIVHCYSLKDVKKLVNILNDKSDKYYFYDSNCIKEYFETR